jgi:signal peptidase II
VLILFAIAAGVLALDIISKAIVVATLSDRPPVRLLGGLLTLRESRNSGAAFSIGTSMTVVFTLIAVGVIVFILRTSRRISGLPWAVALGLLLGGAMGNLTDRIFRSPGPFRGWVVDWIELPHWPVFNLADSSIVCGGVLMVLIAARGQRLDGRAPVAGPRSDPSGREPSEPGQPGPERSGPERSGPGQSGPERSGPGQSGRELSEPGQPGRERSGPGRRQEHPSGGGRG